MVTAQRLRENIETLREIKIKVGRHHRISPMEARISAVLGNAIVEEGIALHELSLEEIMAAIFAVNRDSKIWNAPDLVRKSLVRKNQLVLHAITFFRSRLTFLPGTGDKSNFIRVLYSPWSTHIPVRTAIQWGMEITIS